MKRPLTLALVVVCLTAAGPEARSDQSAGDPEGQLEGRPEGQLAAPHVTLFSAYSLRSTANPVLGDRNEIHTQLTGAALTQMISPQLGLVVFAFGDWLYAEPTLGTFGPTPGDLDGGAGAGFALFWRDPGLGMLSVGYDYGYRYVNSSLDRNDHSLSASGAVFVDEPEVDLRLRFGYSRTSSDPDISTLRADTYSVDAHVGWYVANWLFIGPTLEWSRQERDFFGFDLSETDLRGGVALSALLASGSDCSVTFDLFGSGGRVEARADGFFASARAMENTFVFGFGLSVDLPGAESLSQLFRERRAGSGPIGSGRHTARSL